jgi:hypothetical protein
MSIAVTSTHQEPPAIAFVVAQTAPGNQRMCQPARELERLVRARRLRTLSGVFAHA